MKKIVYKVTGLAIALGLSGCAGTYEPVPNMVKLDAKFSNTNWNGKEIPDNQWCSLFGGNGSTPKIKLSNIPKGTNAIIMEVNDESYMPLSSNGGHGKIGFWIKKGSSSVTLVSVQGETSENLPKDTFIEASSQSTGKYATNGYLPPCSGGRGNLYSADIKAVYKAKNENEKSRLLGKTYITFGRY
jgi:hypothetical protein